MPDTFARKNIWMAIVRCAVSKDSLNQISLKHNGRGPLLDSVESRLRRGGGKGGWGRREKDVQGGGGDGPGLTPMRRPSSSLINPELHETSLFQKLHALGPPCPAVASPNPRECGLREPTHGTPILKLPNLGRPGPAVEYPGPPPRPGDALRDASVMDSSPGASRILPSFATGGSSPNDTKTSYLPGGLTFLT